jgi:hypothetical protein
VRTAPFEHAIRAGVSPDRHREGLPLTGDAAKAHRAERAEGVVGARGEIPDGSGYDDLTIRVSQGSRGDVDAYLLGPPKPLVG